MKTYETQLMIQKAGKEPVRMGFMDVEATSEQEALDIATDKGIKTHDRVCAAIGIRDETTRIWAELI